MWRCLQPTSNVALASEAELCPENHCTGHKLYNNVWAVIFKLHTLEMLEYCYWWRGSWLLEKWSQCVCRRVLFLISPRCRFQGEGQGKKQSFSSIIYFKFIWIDSMEIITESRIVQWQNLIYIAEAGIKGLG